MAEMISGLLWYDDDSRRPLAEKLAQAAARYRERVGYEPTTCQLNPSLFAAATEVKRRRGTRRDSAAAALTLRLEPNEHLRPNYFFVGVLAGERLKPIARRRPAPRGSPEKAGPGIRNKGSEDGEKSSTLHRLKAS